MIKSEPKSILQFVANHFELLRELFETQVDNEVISDSRLESILTNYGLDISSTLNEYKILLEHNDNYIINEPYFNLFEFVLQQFRPLLPEEIDKFGMSIRKLFVSIKQGLKVDDDILISRIESISKEINAFTYAVINNTTSLLSKSRELKANSQGVEYQDKVKQARFWIENYIVPLNTILDVTHPQSIFNELIELSKFANERRFDNSNETIRRLFEQLYNLLKRVTKDLNEQSKILISELLPLIERIKTENEYLKGFHFYLTDGKCYKSILPPGLFNSSRDNFYSPFIYQNTREYFEQYENEEDVVIVEEDSNVNQWIFERSKYLDKLDNNLPVINFFEWCKQALDEEKKDFEFDDYFMVTSLLFEEDYKFTMNVESSTVSIKMKNGELLVPNLIVSKNE